MAKLATAMENGKSARPESNLALITPSASPPSSRSFFPQPYRIPDQPSPTKRPRLSSTPRPFQPHTPSSSSSGTADAVDFHKAREESTMRLLDIWAGLERHSRPIDEDDIIDITTLKVVKDRGVLRGSQTWTVGAFADATAEDDEDEEEEDVDEDDVDELDSFANPGLDDVDLDVDGRRVPPVTEVDPRDAEDLREFLDAERRRKETYGSELDETEGSMYESQTDEAYTEGSRYSELTGTSPSDNATVAEDEDDLSNHELDQTPHRYVEPVYVDSGSDDELDNWDLDEASLVYRLPKVENEVEIVDRPTEAKSPSPEVPFTPATNTKRKVGEPSKRIVVPRQLQTPPQSQTSYSISSATPDDHFVQLPPDSSPPRSSSPFSSQYDSSPTKPQQPKRHPNKPRSEQKRAVRSNLAASSHRIPRLDLTKVSGERPIKPKPNHSTSTTHVLEASSSGSASSSKAKKLSQKSTLASQVVKAKQVEVVIEQRPAFRPTKTSDTPSPMRADGVIERKVQQKTTSGTSVKGKRKQKVTSVDERMESFEVLDSDDPITIPSSPISARKGMPHPPQTRSRRTSASSSVISRDARDIMPDHSTSTSKKPKNEQLAPESASTAGKKRKRVLSNAEMDRDMNEEVPPPTGRTTKPRNRNASTSRVRHPSAGSESAEPSVIREPDVKHIEKRKSAPKQRSRSPAYEADDAFSQEELGVQPQRHFSRAPSHFGDHTYYPYPQHSYPPQPHDQQPHMYAPIPDPRAQFIITQAMQQLSALVGGAWAPPPPPGLPVRGSTPYTPSHYRHYRADPSNSMYSTPTHHPHPYPYSYNPNMSNATLPPDSPEDRSPSPPVASSSSAMRQKSLVRRSQSRGRRVSFRIEEGVVDTMEISANPDEWGKGNGPARERGQNHRGSSTSRERVLDAQNRRKGKRKTLQVVSDADSEAEAESPSRGRSSMRSQTPGPPVQDPRPSKQGQHPVKQPDPVIDRGRSRSGPGRIVP